MTNRGPKSFRILHVTTGLGGGGAEAMLHKLVVATSSAEWSHDVVSLTAGGPIADALATDGVRVRSLDMRPGLPDPRAALRLSLLLRRERPDVVQGWMYHGNLLASVAAVQGIPVVWGLHHSEVGRAKTKPLTHLTRALAARLSGAVPERIVCCAQAVVDSHRAIGYRADRMVVVPNGFAVERFVRDPAAGARVRGELGIPLDAPLVALVARLHPDKDHPNFLAAAARVARAVPAARFVLVGDGVTPANVALASAVRDGGLEGRTHLLGSRRDVPAILSAADVLASSSRTEAFPQVLGEALLCGVPCAATDCGDSREIVGSFGRIVPPSAPDALAAAVVELLAMDPAERSAAADAARSRIVERYDIRAIGERYRAIWRDAASRGDAPLTSARAPGRTAGRTTGRGRGRPRSAR